MKIYQSYFPALELRGLPKEECRRIWKRIFWKPLQHCRFWGLLIAIGFVTGTIMFCLNAFLDQGGLAEIVIRGTLSVLGGLFIVFMFMRIARPYLREERERTQSEQVGDSGITRRC